MPLAMYDGTPENRPKRRLRDALKIYKDEGCRRHHRHRRRLADGLAKAVGLMATHPGNSLQTYSFVEGGAPRITSCVAPIVAMPRPRAPAAR